MLAHAQRRNLRIVYDAIGTLADAVGGELNQVQDKLFFQSLMSRLLILPLLDIIQIQTCSWTCVLPLYISDFWFLI